MSLNAASHGWRLFLLLSCSSLAQFLVGATKIVDELHPIIAKKQLQFADEILDQLRKLVRVRYDDWFSKFSLEDRPALLFIVIGFDKNINDYIPCTNFLVSQTDFAPQLFSNGNALGGVPQYAVYLMHRRYHLEMTVADVARLADYLISETAMQDPKEGGPVRIATTTTKERYQELDTDNVEEMIRLNNEQNDRLKQFFFGGSNYGKS